MTKDEELLILADLLRPDLRYAIEPWPGPCYWVIRRHQDAGWYRDSYRNGTRHRVLQELCARYKHQCPRWWVTASVNPSYVLSRLRPLLS